MITKIVSFAAAVAFVGSSAFAQTAAGDTASETTNAADQAQQMQWEEPVANVFYSDVKARTLRPEAEWTKNWSGLTDEQRAKVQADCAADTATPRDEGDTRVCDWAGNN